MHVEEGAPLAPLTTFGIGGAAKRLVRAEDERELVACVNACDRDHEPVLVLGGGSNILVADGGYDGTVVVPAFARTEVIEAAEGEVVVGVAAGNDWDQFVAWAAGEGLSGAECLSGIPGSVGATPIQNVGAYGVEVKDFLREVRVFDRERSIVLTVPSEDCGFRYRSSRFKGDPRYVVLDVTFVLRRSPDSVPVRYAELCRALDCDPGTSRPVGRVRDTILTLRRSKGMVLDPADPDSKSAGSFFTNPIVSPAVAQAIEARVGGPLPRFAEGALVKVPAAFLIERAGVTKGFRLDGSRAHVSTKHALALVNGGGATAAEILALASHVRGRVRDAFGVALEAEPVLVGCSL